MTSLKHLAPEQEFDSREDWIKYIRKERVKEEKKERRAFLFVSIGCFLIVFLGLLSIMVYTHLKN